MFSLPSSNSFRIWLLLTILLISGSKAFCPIKCHCDDSLLLAECTGGSLDQVPITLNPQLRELHLAANQIKSVKETLSFYNNLLLLDLSDNQLQTLGERNFNQLRNLKVLKIGNNRLSQLNNQTFAGLINLQQLHLPHNELRSVHSGVWKNLNRLRLLDLSHNALVTLQSDVFVNLVALELLNLSHNRFDSKLSALIFDRLTSLKILHLDHNSLQQLPDFLFRTLNQLQKLTLNHCELRNLDRNLFFGLENLRHLKISHNQLNQLPTDVFHYLGNLETLDLQGTALLQLPNIFAPLKSIKHLSLGFDRFLKQLTSDLFNQNARLQSIAIEHCPSLEQLPIGLFNTQRQLALINLGQNALSILHPNIFSNYTQIQRLILIGNPLNCDCNLAWLYSLSSLRSDKLTASTLAKKLSISIEDAEELERILERWSGKELDQAYINKHDISLQNHQHSSHKILNFKQQQQNHQRSKTSQHANEIDFNSAEYQDQFNQQINQQNSNHQNLKDYSSLDNLSNQYLKDQPGQLQSNQIQTDQTQRNNELTATCFEPLALVGRPLIELKAAELNCNANLDAHQSILINGEKINFESRNPATMIFGYDEQQYPMNNKDQFNTDDFLTNNTSSGLDSFTLCFVSVFVFCLVLFAILFGFIYMRRHKKEHQAISSWILKPGASNNATLSFQPFASFDMNQEHLNQPKCNTLVNPLAKLGPLPKKPINSSLINQNNLLLQNSSNSSSNLNYNANSNLSSNLSSNFSSNFSPNINSNINPNFSSNLNSNLNSNISSNSTLMNSKIKLTPQITRISNLTNSNNPELTNKLYEQIDYTGFEREQIYEDLVDDLNDLNTTNYGYQQLNSTTSTASSYLSNGLNAPTTYEEFLATALMRSTPNSYGALNGTLNSQTNRLISNLNGSNMNSNFNRVNSNSRRTLNTMAHL